MAAQSPAFPAPASRGRRNADSHAGGGPRCFPPHEDPVVMTARESPKKAARMSTAPALPIADRTLTGLTQVFKLLADESRLRILLTLAREGEMHVSALCNML